MEASRPPLRNINVGKSLVHDPSYPVSSCGSGDHQRVAVEAKAEVGTETMVEVCRQTMVEVCTEAMAKA
jgi:hypothetical protein